MSKHKYKFTNKKHSVGGVAATIMAAAAIVLIVFSMIKKPVKSKMNISNGCIIWYAMDDM